MAFPICALKKIIRLNYFKSPLHVKFISTLAPKVYFHGVLSPAHVLNASLPEARDIQCFILTCAGNIKLFNKTIGVKVRPKEMKTFFGIYIEF